jgi:hypothetical protein
MTPLLVMNDPFDLYRYIMEGPLILRGQRTANTRGIQRGSGLRPAKAAEWLGRLPGLCTTTPMLRSKPASRGLVLLFNSGFDAQRGPLRMGAAVVRRPAQDEAISRYILIPNQQSTRRGW